jgi:hypothetical protein
MRTLLLVSVVLMLLAALGFVAFTVFGGGDVNNLLGGAPDEEGTELPSSENPNPANNDGQQPNDGSASSDDQFSDADSPDTDPPDNPVNPGNGDGNDDPLDPLDGGTSGDQASGGNLDDIDSNSGTKGSDELPRTDLVSDTVDMILFGFVLVIVSVVLIKTNIIGKKFFPMSEYLQFNFFSVDDTDPNHRRKVENQLEEINRNIRSRQQ